MRLRLALVSAAAVFGIEAPAEAQDMQGMDHGKAASGLDPAPPADSLAELSGTDLPVGNAGVPPRPTDRYADRVYPVAEMQRSHDQMMKESGAQTFAAINFNFAEYQPRRGNDAFRWEGEGWFGGDVDRVVVKTEGEGRLRNGVDDAEVQLLYSRAIDPYFNVQAGVRQDLGRGPRRTYATVGVEGLAPYWFEVEAALFLSDKGDVLGRMEGYYDQRITQKFVLQPRVELNLAAQDVRDNGVGAGLSTAEAGLRLRYQITPQVAPYVGVSWERKVGRTARYARADGEEVTSSGFVAGVRFWF